MCLISHFDWTLPGCRGGICVPIGLGFRLSPFFFAVPQRDSLPQHAPVPGSTGEAVLVAAALRLNRVLLPVDGVNERHRAHGSDMDAHTHAGTHANERGGARQDPENGRMDEQEMDAGGRWRHKHKRDDG